MGRDRLLRAEENYPGSGLGKALDAWLRVAEGAKWRHFMDVRATWSGVDNVPPHVVFDIFTVGGKRFRLTTMIGYEAQAVLVVRVQSHAEYTRKGL